MSMKLTLFTLAALCSLGRGVPASAAESVRTREIYQCRNDEVMTWGDGQDRPALASTMRFTYNPDGQPPWFSPAVTAAMVALAAASWSQCGVPSEMLPWRQGGKPPPGVIVVQWSEKGSGGNFGLANLRQRTLSLGPKAFGLLRSKNPSWEAGETLQMVISHEMGHLFGLMAHSRRCVDVMSYYDNGKGDLCYSRDRSQINSVTEYRNDLPTACDIERCRQANGKTSLFGGRRVLNQTEP